MSQVHSSTGSPAGDPQRLLLKESLSVPERIRALELVHRLSSSMVRTGHGLVIYDAALDIVLEALGAERASLLLLDDEGVMRFRAWRGLSDGYRKAVDGHSPWTVHTVDPKVIVVPDALAEPSLGAVREAILSEGIRALVFVPLVFEGRLLGKFMAYFSRPRTFTPADVQLAETVANHVAFAIAHELAATERTRLIAEIEAERARLEAVVNHLPVGLVFADAPTGRLVMANDQARQIFRLGEADVALSVSGIEQFDAFQGYHADGRRYEADEWPLARALLREEHIRNEEIRIVRGDNTRGTISVSAAPIRDRDGQVLASVVAFEDVTERKQRQESLRFLAEARMLLAESLDFETTLGNVADLVVPGLADWCAIDLLDDKGALHRVALKHPDSEKLKIAEELRRRYPPERSKSVLWQAIDEGRSIRLPVVEEAYLRNFSEDEEHFEMLRSIRFRSVIVAPLLARGRSLGTIILVTSESERTYEEEDQLLVEELARSCAVAVDNARLYQEAQREIVERKRAEAALRESEQRYRFLSEMTSDYIFSYRRQEGGGFRLDWISDAFERLTGYGQAEIAGIADWQRLVDPADVQQLQAFLAAMEESRAHVMEVRLRTRTQGFRWLRVFGRPVWSAETSRVEQILGAAQDISERRAAEEEVARLNRDLRRRVTELQALFDVAPVGLAFAEDPECQKISANPAFTDLLGVEAGTSPAKAGPAGDQLPFEVLRNGVKATVDQLPMVRAASEDVTIRDQDLEIVRADGRHIPLLAFAAPLHDEQDAVRGAVGVFLDMTEIRRSQEAQRLSERRLRYTLEAARVGTWDWDLVTGEVIWSENLEEIHGRRRGDFQSDFASVLEDVVPEDVEKLQRTIAETLAGRVNYHVQYRVRAADGRLLWVEGKGRAQYDEKGQPVRISGICTDITELKQAEAALRESEQRFRQLADAMPQIVWIISRDREATFVNRQWREYTGLTLEESSDPARLVTVLHADDLPTLVERWLEAERCGDTFQTECRMRRPDDGEYRWFLTRAVPIRDEAGEIVEWFGTSTDIDDQKRAEAALVEQSHHLSTINHVTAALAAELDLEKLIHTVTEAGADLTGAECGAFVYREETDGGVAYRLQELVGVGCPDPELYPTARMAALFGPAFVANASLRLDDAEGELPGTGSFLAVPVVGRSGEAIGGLVFTHARPGIFDAPVERLIRGIADQAAIAIENARLYDAAQAELRERERAQRQLRELNETLEQRVARRTVELETLNTQLRDEVHERARAERALERTNAALVQSNRELQEFAYVASHDLQEPLRKISSFADLLRSDHGPQLNPTGRLYIDRMQEAAVRMSDLLRDLLAFSRVRTRGEPFENVELEGALADALSDLELQIRETGAQIDLELMATIEADRTQMRQLFQNLVGNALKFSHPGEAPHISIRARVERKKHGAPLLCRIEVEDHGIGFDEKYLDRIFAPFQRLHARNMYPGTGMGLAICRRIAERHHGTITAHSRPGEGSVFEVVLPVHQGDFEADPPVEPLTA